MTIVFLNGASGAGKTTIARRLNLDFGIPWFHPDGVWDTPNMDQRQLTFRCVEHVLEQHEGTVVIDTQFRGAFIEEVRQAYTGVEIRQTLLDCSDEARTERLLARGSDPAAIRTQIAWAGFLRSDAAGHGVSIIDTSTIRTEETIVAVMSTTGLTDQS